MKLACAQKCMDYIFKWVGRITSEFKYLPCKLLWGHIFYIFNLKSETIMESQKKFNVYIPIECFITSYILNITNNLLGGEYIEYYFLK